MSPRCLRKKGSNYSSFTRVIAVNSPEPGWNMQPRLLSAVTMVTHERGAALSPPDSSLRGGENVTQSTRRGEKVLCELLPGNFNWALKCFFSFDNIFSLFLPEAALIGVPFCLLLGFHRSDEDLYNWIFIWKDLNVRPATRTDAAVFSASLLLLKWKWPCCGAYGSANGARLQLFSPWHSWKYTVGPREDVPSSVWSSGKQYGAFVLCRVLENFINPFFVYHRCFEMRLLVIKAAFTAALFNRATACLLEESALFGECVSTQSNADQRSKVCSVKFRKCTITLGIMGKPNTNKCNKLTQWISRWVVIVVLSRFLLL